MIYREDDEKKKQAKEAFKNIFKNRLKDMDMTLEQFAEIIEDNHLHKELYDIDRNVPLKAIKEIEKTEGECPDLRGMWAYLDMYKKNKSLKVLFDLDESDLLWIVNNLKILIEIPEHERAFFVCATMLNEKGKKEFMESINYLKDSMNFSLGQEKMEEIIWKTEEDYEITNQIDALIKVYENKDEYKDYWKCDSKERKEWVEVWKLFRNMNEDEKKLWNLYRSYSGAKVSKQTYEQVAILTTIFLVKKNRKNIKSGE